MADDAIGEKIRLRFSKTGDLRFLSHHDLMRCAERMLRRADIPFRSTAGFHPTPRLVFALSLPLGVVGRNEVVELELTRPSAVAEVRERLNRAAPRGLSFHAANVVPPKASAVPHRAVYGVTIPADRAEAVRVAADLLLAEPKIWVDKYHPRPRRVNVRPYIRGICIVADVLTLDLWVTGQGTARAEDILAFLGLPDTWADGAVLERTDLEIHDETPEGRSDGPPVGPPDTAPLNHAPAAVAGEEDDSAHRATWGMSPSGPAVE